MYEGKVMSDESMALVTNAIQRARGEMVFNHPRCGRVKISQREDGVWWVTEVQRPDPVPQVIASATGAASGKAK